MEKSPRRISHHGLSQHGRIIAGTAVLALGMIAGGTTLAYSAISHSIDSASSSSNTTTVPSQRNFPNFARRAADTSSATPATAAQKVGVVTIVSTVDYNPSEQAAGTGTILSASGLILTNNHVIEGSTGIEVTVESTGRTYTATVVGTDATDDVAVLQLARASGLTTARYATSAATTGDAVTAIGNAEGTGDLVSASGAITATNQSITVQGDTTDSSENLSNLIEVNADIVPGDSGGPLLNAGGQVVGMDTAASSGSSQTVGYAIPIAQALSIAKQIESGVESGNVTLGYPAFLGVELASSSLGSALGGIPTTGDSSTGALVAGAIAGTPAEAAGIVAGDTITAIDGTPVGTASALSPLIAAHNPGDSVSVSFTDASGASHTATLTLQAGPAL